MNRTAINPVTWAENIYNQGEVIQGISRHLSIAGQVSVQPDADAPFGVVAKHPGDMRMQMAEVLANISTVLDGAGMTPADLTHLTFYVTDNNAGLSNFDVFMEWVGDARPPQSFITVSGLALEGLVIEISATAAR